MTNTLITVDANNNVYFDYRGGNPAGLSSGVARIGLMVAAWSDTKLLTMSISPGDELGDRPTVEDSSMF